ncbi:flagellar biosynthesis anti-sigma factor FlgM [Pelomonas sp. CA6]|uniref:flagellar biosynthesis anti-sigma factor FlgM n=1 Tax=Pelomonas sp. CA6 TaxID=2907999 RepID=UPI001F4BD8B0|nr:flagellar biosynthesis anti-sigma factor FlgM [Pelomonas sp. CA6]MCH7345270.1 flagellar biosynthesis anti-sigma factor FlgM [Pelomonas sp. CA6]
MKITPQGGALTPLSAAQPAQAAQDAGPAAAAPAMRTADKLESGVLKPAQEALAALPEIDHDKVAALREALAKGEIRFDAGRLAQLIQRYHGGRG